MSGSFLLLLVSIYSTVLEHWNSVFGYFMFLNDGIGRYSYVNGRFRRNRFTDKDGYIYIEDVIYYEYMRVMEWVLYREVYSKRLYHFYTVKGKVAYDSEKILNILYTQHLRLPEIMRAQNLNNSYVMDDDYVEYLQLKIHLRYPSNDQIPSDLKSLEENLALFKTLSLRNNKSILTFDPVYGPYIRDLQAINIIQENKQCEKFCELNFKIGEDTGTTLIDMINGIDNNIEIYKSDKGLSQELSSEAIRSCGILDAVYLPGNVKIELHKSYLDLAYKIKKRPTTDLLNQYYQEEENFKMICKNKYLEVCEKIPVKFDENKFINRGMEMRLNIEDSYIRHQETMDEIAKHTFRKIEKFEIFQRFILHGIENILDFIRYIGGG